MCKPSSNSADKILNYVECFLIHTEQGISKVIYLSIFRVGNITLF